VSLDAVEAQLLDEAALVGDLVLGLLGVVEDGLGEVGADRRYQPGEQAAGLGRLGVEADAQAEAEPGSLVRSRTAMDRTVGGSAATSSAAGKGWKSRTRTMPTGSPAATSASTVSSAAPAAEPITTTTRSASGAPWWSTKP
jgi:hypothetical protein